MDPSPATVADLGFLWLSLPLRNLSYIPSCGDGLVYPENLRPSARPELDFENATVDASLVRDMSIGCI